MVSSLWHPATVTDREPAGGGLTRIHLVLPAEVAASHDTPGQYVEVRAKGETGYFVLSSDPGSSPWELVMRDGGGASDVLLVMPLPGAIEVTAAIGTGFPMRDVSGRELLVALGGTGIAAGPPLMRRRIGDGDARLTRVWVGAQFSQFSSEKNSRHKVGILHYMSDMSAARGRGRECIWQQR